MKKSLAITLISLLAVLSVVLGILYFSNDRNKTEQIGTNRNKQEQTRTKRNKTEQTATKRN